MCISHLEYVNQLVQNDLKYVFNYDFLNFGPAKSHIKKSLWDIAPEILMLSEETTDKTFSHISGKQVGMQLGKRI